MDVSLTLSILSFTVSFIALIINFKSEKRSDFKATVEFHMQMIDERFMKARSFLYNHNGDLIPLNDNKENNYVTVATNLYHNWGYMILKKQLPMSIFWDKKTGLTAEGIAVIILYEKLKKTIEHHREIKNPKYAEYFTFLYDALKAKEKQYCPRCGKRIR